MSEISFTALQKDAIIELVNIGIGTAAEALSQMVNEEIILSIPDVQFISHEKLFDYMTNIDANTPTVVMQKFNGDFSGNGLLVFPGDSGTTIVRQMLRNSVGLCENKELEEEALLEIGNIILNACFGQLGNKSSQI